MSPDVIIVGGGTAGCVLAGRLSEDPDRQILLLEAGPDYRVDELPADLADGMHGPSTSSHDWGLTGWAGGRALAAPRGRVLGGSSAVNATFALRGSPHDYDAWGLAGWSFADVLPAFIALERDLDFGSAPYHGDSGPVPIRRYAGDELSPVAAALIESTVDVGIPRVDDHNAPFAVGVSTLPVNALDGRRMSTALTHLEPARHRPNLSVRAAALVESVDIRDGRARGVRLHGGEMIAGGEVVVCCGAYGSPGLLRRSGIARPAVGENLVDHPVVSVDLPYLGPQTERAVFQAVATLHSAWADPASEPPDLQILAGGPWPGTPPVFFIGAALLKPRSRGRVGERIEFNYFDDPSDVARLAEGLARVEEIVSSSAVARLAGGERLSPRPSTPAEVDAWMKQCAWTYHHPVGTCAMGTVVDEDCRVPDVSGLSIVDASVVPEIPSANTNLPTLMLAEQVANRRLAGSTRRTVARP
jgi:choline dehydrogenase